MKQKSLLFTLALILIFSFLSTHAQDTPKPERLMVMQDVVRPNMTAVYIKAQKEMNNFIIKNKFGVSWDVIRTDDNTYSYVVPFSKFADLDSIFNMWNDKMKSADQKEMGKDMMAFTGTIDHNNSIILQKSKYSYKAKNPYLKKGEAKLIHFDYYEIIPGKEHEAWKLASNYKKLYEKNNVDASYNVWSVAFGDHSSTIVVTTWAKNAVDFYTMETKVNEQLKKESKDFDTKFMSCVNKVKRFNGHYVKYLSIGNSE